MVHKSYKNGMLDQRGKLSKCSKLIIIKANFSHILYKPVVLYPFTMACIQSVLSVIYRYLTVSIKSSIVLLSCIFNVH